MTVPNLRHLSREGDLGGLKAEERYTPIKEEKEVQCDEAL